MKTQQRIESRELRRDLFESHIPKDLLAMEHQRIEHMVNNRHILKALDKTDVCVGCYISMGSEASTEILRDDLQKRGLSLAVPVIDADINHGEMGFVCIEKDTPMTLSEQRFAQPLRWSKSDLIYPDIIIVPLLAFDKDGHRLGYGKGHYDKYFAREIDCRDTPSLRIGWAYARQHISKLTTNATDIPMDIVVTEHKLWSWL